MFDKLIAAFQPHRELSDGPVLWPGEASERVKVDHVPSRYPDPIRQTAFNTRDSFVDVVTFHGLWDYWSNPQFVNVSYGDVPFVAIPAGKFEVDPIRRNIRKPPVLPLGAFFELGPNAPQEY